MQRRLLRVIVDAKGICSHILVQFNCLEGFTPTAPLRSPSPSFDLIWSDSGTYLRVELGLPLKLRLRLGLFTDEGLYSVRRKSNKNEIMEVLDAMKR